MALKKNYHVDIKYHMTLNAIFSVDNTLNADPSAVYLHWDGFWLHKGIVRVSQWIDLGRGRN